MNDERFRALPAVEPLVERALAALAADGPAGDAPPRSLVVEAVRTVLAAERAALAADPTAAVDAEGDRLARVVERARALARPRQERVINATGVVLHTNLGRAPLSKAARRALDEASRGYLSLEYDVPEGKRSKGRGLTVAKTGVARLAIEMDCPIVPVAVTGSDKFFKRFPHRTRVRIEFLPPLLPKPGESPLVLTDRLMFTLAQSLPEDMRGVYAEMPQGFAMQM